jgi:hypothetical protein
MSRYRHIRRRWLAMLRRSGGSLVCLLAYANYLFPGPLPYPPGTAQPGARQVNPELAPAPLTLSERRVWERLVQDLRAEPDQDGH